MQGEVGGGKDVPMSTIYLEMHPNKMGRWLERGMDRQIRNKATIVNGSL